MSLKTFSNPEREFKRISRTLWLEYLTRSTSSLATAPSSQSPRTQTTWPSTTCRWPTPSTSSTWTRSLPTTGSTWTGASWWAFLQRKTQSSLDPTKTWPPSWRCLPPATWWKRMERMDFLFQPALSSIQLPWAPKKHDRRSNIVAGLQRSHQMDNDKHLPVFETAHRLPGLRHHRVLRRKPHHAPSHQDGLENGRGPHGKAYCHFNHQSFNRPNQCWPFSGSQRGSTFCPSDNIHPSLNHSPQSSKYWGSIITHCFTTFLRVRLCPWSSNKIRLFG